MEEFYNYKYKTFWINNHQVNTELNTKVSWEVNMLWSEKICFVEKTATHYFKDVPDAWYGWCDIGYFRPQSAGCLTASQIQTWPDPQRLAQLDPAKIHYALVNPYIAELIQCVKNRDPHTGIPNIPPDQISVAGGFFLTIKDNLEYWAKTFDEKLELYFQHGALVKDDQMIIIDCILSDPTRFKLHREENPGYDNWFMFQRLLA
jgi:hypothetical protein